MSKKIVTDQIAEELVQSKGEGRVKGLLLAEQQDGNVLILTHISAIDRFDGERASYALEHRWLSDKSNVHSVQGNDFSYWRRKELRELGVMKEKGTELTGKSLFDCFELVG
jgi:hypothetical protein